MAAVLRNRWAQLGGVSIVTAVVVGLIGYLVFSESGETVGPSTGDHVSFTSGGKIFSMGRVVDSQFGAGEESRPLEELPLAARDAVAAGWKDPFLCDSGRGRFFQKETAGQVEPYFLMYNHLDELIGVYLYSESEMPLPWSPIEELQGGGQTLLDFPHWSLLVYFRDPTQACPTRESGAVLSYYGDSESKVSTYGTPVPPTPTPTLEVALGGTATRMAALRSLSFTLTGEGAPPVPGMEAQSLSGEVTLPDQVSVRVTDASGTLQDVEAGSLPISFADLGATVSGLASGLQDPVEAPSQWIDNRPHRGVSGTVPGSLLAVLFSSADPGASAAVTLYVGENDLVRRIRIEGSLAPGDPADAARVLDLEDLR